MGMRAAESPARAKMVAFEHDKASSNSRRHVDKWLPLHDWTAAQVWERIRESKVRHHPAYDLGMPRLSCVFCIYAPRDALLLAGEHNPELLAEYVSVERLIRHKFKADLAIEEIQDALARGERAAKPADWAM
jgi:3'-phosphoadenosine 5'-phosphosulfate sulfotransferase (PAPS reductase)/FAD synthetase